MLFAVVFLHKKCKFSQQKTGYYNVQHQKTEKYNPCG